MKRITTLVSILLLAAPMALFAGNGRGRAQSGGPSGIHTPGTAQPGGVPQGTPGGQRLRDGSGAGSGQQKRQGQNGQSGQQNPSCPNQPPAK